MSMNRDLLVRLLGEPSPTGFETRAANIWRVAARNFAKLVTADSLGNSFAHGFDHGREGAIDVMLAGHIDEIGLQITRISKEGFLSFALVGGWDTQILPGQRVVVYNLKEGSVSGVIGRKPIHLTDEEDRKKVVKVEDLWIDIGVQGEDESKTLVEVGDYAVIDYGFVDLERNGLVVARGLDDRIGAFVVLEALREALQTARVTVNVVAVATTQEEIGFRGGTVSCFGLNPRVGIAVDVGFATDTPGMDDAQKKVGDVKVGMGPIITRGPNVNPELLDLILSVARGHKIPVQIVANPKGTGTDANAMQISRAGVAAAVIGIPNRYMHSPCEMVSLQDVGWAIELIAEVVTQITPDTDFTI